MQPSIQKPGVVLVFLEGGLKLNFKQCSRQHLVCHRIRVSIVVNTVHQLTVSQLVAEADCVVGTCRYCGYGMKSQAALNECQKRKSQR